MGRGASPAHFDKTQPNGVTYMKFRRYLPALIGLLCAAAVLAGCNNTAQNPGSSTEPSSAPNPEPEETGIATLYVDFSAGSVENYAETRDVGYTGELDAQCLSDLLSELTGLDFAIEATVLDNGDIVVDWQPEATLIGGLGDREQNDDYHFYESESLAWFMLDSLARTIRANIDMGGGELYYTQNGGEQLIVPGLPEWAVFLPDVPYMSSAAYYEGRDNTYVDTFLEALRNAIGEANMAGRAIVEMGETQAGGETCIMYALGTDTAEKFTAEEHFAVGPTGKVYQMDTAGNWVLLKE